MATHIIDDAMNIKMMLEFRFFVKTIFGHSVQFVSITNNCWQRWLEVTSTHISGIKITQHDQVRQV